MWGATGETIHRHTHGTSFNSRTPCGVRRNIIGVGAVGTSFQFTHPVWGATPKNGFCQFSEMFQFTHPVWGATLDSITINLIFGSFNSRTPCGVRQIIYIRYCHMTVSIHAPRVGCDTLLRLFYPPRLCFNSRTPCGVRLPKFIQACFWTVSIHAPRVGCDRIMVHLIYVCPWFQFTHPVWGATT